MRAGVGVAPEEHRERHGRAREAAAVRGLHALISISRGGGAHDRVADALWLAGLATPQPFVPDLGGHWRAAGHVAVVVPVDGPVTAVVESEELRTSAVAHEVVVSEDVSRRRLTSWPARCPGFSARG